MVLSLFIKKDFISHAGIPLDFKIECDSLTDEDLDTLAYLVDQRLNFSKVVGIPKGGLRFAKALEKYQTGQGTHPILLVDDVLTTGGSMNLHKINLHPAKVRGLVIFSRCQPGTVPDWIDVLFRMW